MTNSDTKAILSFSDGSTPLEMPIYKGTVGPDVIDIRKLYAATGMFTYDPGFMSTAACNSSITYIDGDKGELLYRGYPIEQLAEKGDFLETCYLLLNGELPNVAENKEFAYVVSRHTMVHEQLHFLYRCWLVQSVPWHRSTMIPWISTIRIIVKCQRFACWQKCRHWWQWRTNIPSVNRSFIQKTICHSAPISCT